MGKNFPQENDIYAADEGSLGGGKIIAKFCRIELLDDDGDVDESFWADTTGRWAEESPEDIFETREFAKDIHPYEWDEIIQIIQIDRDADYDLDEDKWIGGLESVVHGEDTDPECLRGAITVSVLPYYDVEAELDSSEDYGVKVDGEPSDEHNFIGVLLAPNPKELMSTIDEADSVEELVGICNEWKANLPIIREALDKAEAMMPNGSNIETHLELARLEVYPFGLPNKSYVILSTVKKLIAAEFYEDSTKSSNLLALAKSINFLFPLKQEEAIQLLREAAVCTEDEDDVNSMIFMQTIETLLTIQV